MLRRMFDPQLIGWRAQHHRMLRGLSRLRRGYGSSVEYQDDLQHFLQDCWHLKDWIENDLAVDAGIRARVESQVNAPEALKIVGDLAIACKHFNHDRRDRQRTGMGSYVTRNDVTVHMGQNRPADITFWITTGDGRVMKAQDLVEQAAAAWDVVLRRLGLAS